MASNHIALTPPHKTAPELLVEASKLMAERNAKYGSNYMTVGKVLEAIFPNGVTLKTTEDHVRFGLFKMNIDKLIRYGANITTGGHMDSAMDGINYMALLAEVTKDSDSDFPIPDGASAQE